MQRQSDFDRKINQSLLSNKLSQNTFPFPNRKTKLILCHFIDDYDTYLNIFDNNKPMHALNQILYYLCLIKSIISH